MTIDPVIAAKLEGYDKAIERVQAIADKQPTPDQLNERLQALKELMKMLFEQLELRTNAVASSDKKALDAAFTAAKEQFSSLELRISDVKDRVVGMEAGGQGSRQSYGAIATTVGLIIGAASIVVAVILSQGTS